MLGFLGPRCETTHMFILERLISTLAPHQCLTCGAEGATVCAWCLPDFIAPVPARCYRCRVATENSAVCRKCRRTSPLSHVWVRTTYEGDAKLLVHGLKFQRKRAAAAVAGKLTAEALPYLDRSMIVAHVPTATSHVRQRGYDHAELVAKTIAKESGLSYTPLLARVGQARQVGAKREQRLVQLQNAFHVRKPQVIQKARILLVDDIVTTGATLEAAGRVLRNAGAKTVDAVVFAQKH